MGAALAGVLVLASLTVWTWRLEVSRLTATRLLDRWGLGPVSLNVGAIGFYGLRVRDISLLGGAIRVEELTLAYDPFRLIGGVVDHATIGKARVTVGMADGGLLIGRSRFDVAGSADGASPMGAYRIGAIRIDDAQVTIETPTGPVEARFSTDLAFSDVDTSGTALAVDLVMPLAGAARAVRIVVPTLALSPADGGLRLRFSQVAVQPRDVPWAVADLAGEVVWQTDRMTARLISSRVSSTGTPAVIVPFEVTGEASMVGSRIDFGLHALSAASSGAGGVRLDMIGSHDRLADTGRSKVEVAPIIFQAGGTQPRDFFPTLADSLRVVSGSAALSGTVAWRQGAISPNLVLRLADVAYEPDSVRVSNVSGDIAIAGLWPVLTRPNQVLTGLVEAGGLPPIKTTLAFQLLPKPALRVEAIRMDFVGGRIATSPFTIDPARPSVDTVLAFHQVDLAEFFKLVGVDGLTGSGRLDGTIPMKVAPGAVAIVDGHLSSTGAGVIRFDSFALPKQITDAGESMTLVLQALADFHYDSLVIALSGQAAGDGTVLLKLQGNNPALLDGRPFHININLQSNFDRLVDIALRSMEAAQALLRRTTGSARR